MPNIEDIKLWSGKNDYEIIISIANINKKYYAGYFIYSETCKNAGPILNDKLEPAISNTKQEVIIKSIEYIINLLKIHINNTCITKYEIDYIKNIINHITIFKNMKYNQLTINFD